MAEVEAYANAPLTEIDIPESLSDNLALFLRLEHLVLKEYDERVCEAFDTQIGRASCRERV